MRRLSLLAYLLLFSILIISCNSAGSLQSMNETPVGEFGPKQFLADAISKVELKHHLSFLASDEFRGRDTGTPQLKIAAKYIANELESYGYSGLAENGSFFQNIKLFKPEYDYKSLEISYGGQVLNLKYGQDYAIYGYGGTRDYTVSAPLVGIGLGINFDGMTSYDPSTVKDAVALRFAVEGDLWEKYKNVREFHQGIRNHLYSEGAKSVIMVVNDPERQKMEFERYMAIPQGAVQLEEEANPRTYILLSRSAFDQIIAIEKTKAFKSDKAYKFKSTISISLKTIAEEAYTRNVVAFIKGTDPQLSNEYVGFGAHYDHIGIRRPVNGDSINNGANDDGSGTVGLLSVAKAIAKNPPRRSVMIIFHTGEEKGLWGSDYYVNHPLIPLKDMVAVVNMDMIGSNHKPEEIYIVGADRISQELHDINEMMNKKLDNVILDYEWNQPFHPERIYYRSDHYNYAKKGIPIIFYSDDDPKNYHKPSDEVSEINFDKLRRIARLAFSTGYYVANKPERLKITTPVEPPKYSKDFADKLVGTYTAKEGWQFNVIYENECLYFNFFGRRAEMIKVDENTFNAIGIKVSFDFNNSNEAQFMTTSIQGREIKAAKKGFTLPE